MKTLAKTVESADRHARFDHIHPLYLEALTLVERLHRRLLGELPRGKRHLQFLEMGLLIITAIETKDSHSVTSLRAASSRLP